MGRLVCVTVIFLLLFGGLYFRQGNACPQIESSLNRKMMFSDSVVLSADSTLYFIVGNDSITADSMHQLIWIDYHTVCRQIDTLLAAIPVDTILVKQLDERYNKRKNDYRALDSIYASKRTHTDSAHIELPIILHGERSTVDFLKQLKAEMVLYAVVQSVVNTDTIINAEPNINTPFAAVVNDSTALPAMGGSDVLIEDTLNAKFISAVYESDTISLRRLFTGFDKQGLTKAWMMYQGMKFGEDKIDSHFSLTDGQEQLGDVSQASSLSSRDSSKKQVRTQNPQSVDEFIAGFSESEKNTPISAFHAEGLVFYVQISASRRKVSEHFFKTGLQDGLFIREHQEDGWYKYQVGGTSDYSQARKILHQIRVNGAFIVAYQNNKKVNLWSVLHRSTHDQYYVADSLAFGSDGVVFGVQISASRGEADPSELKKVPAGTGRIFMVIEDGWHKYVILAGRSMGDAKALQKRLSIKGAFPVAYYKGKRIATKEAMQIVKRMKAD
jgi:hypothetical protein